jgi:FtsH-binding integral membrane protein
MFRAMALNGSTTTRSLAGVGRFLFMGLIGIVLASLVGLFWHNNALQFVIAAVGVLVFTGTQCLGRAAAEANGAGNPGGTRRLRRHCGRPRAFLDFLNLFLSLLRPFGTRRE